MPTVMAYHDVKDKDHWLASPKREEFFGPLGVTNIRTFADPQNPARVGLVMDVADMGAVTAAMETQPAADAMAHDGVLPETLVILVEAEPSRTRFRLHGGAAMSSWYDAWADRYDDWSTNATGDVPFYVGLARDTDGPLVELAV